MPGFSREIQRALPIFSVDGGLYFDRDVKFARNNYKQTLEPRIFYLYVPYRNQDSIPLFDTALIPFSYDSLFATNRFSGLDRIGDANQVALALTTRFLDQNTGMEKFRASIGQLFYFHDRRVSVCTPAGTPGSASTNIICSNPFTVIGATSPTDRVSPLAGQLRYYFNPLWNTTANVAWDTRRRERVNANWTVQYHPQQDRVFNFNYNFIRFGDPITTTSMALPSASHKNDLNQAGFSFAWPLYDRWSTVGGWNYNISHVYSQNFFYGVQYDSCCWAVRLVIGRVFTALNQNGNPTFNNSVYLQWQFKGLGTVGTQDPTGLLTGGIPGYHDNFQTFQGLAT